MILDCAAARTLSGFFRLSGNEFSYKVATGTPGRIIRINNDQYYVLFDDIPVSIIVSRNDILLPQQEEGQS